MLASRTRSGRSILIVRFAATVMLITAQHIRSWMILGLLSVFILGTTTKRILFVRTFLICAKARPKPIFVRFGVFIFWVSRWLWEVQQCILVLTFILIILMKAEVLLLLKEHNLKQSKSMITFWLIWLRPGPASGPQVLNFGF